MLLNDVLNALATSDPANLIAIGCPQDEYLPEARDVTLLIEEGELNYETLEDVFARWFPEEIITAEKISLSLELLEDLPTP